MGYYTEYTVSCDEKNLEKREEIQKKGRLVYIGGRLKFDSWDDKQTGQKRSKLSVVAESVQFLDYGDEKKPTQPGQPPQQANGQNGEWGSGEPDFGPPPF